MISMPYIGPREDLKDTRALVQLFNDAFVKVQFNECFVPELCFNWHDFPIEDFFGHYRIKRCVFGRATGAYRVVDHRSEEESCTTDYVTCQWIVMNALAGNAFSGEEWNGNLLYPLDRYYQWPGWEPLL